MPTLNWIGKDKIINHHLDVPYRILDKKYTYNNAESDNKIIHGDNLEALKALLPEYEGRVNCIYIDPPYNTGNENWVYNDNVNDPKIKKWLGEVVGKESEDLTRHDKWLCMMYPRLKLLHKLLAEDGAIFISIDDNEQANLRLICDEIFGKNNFINNIIWQKKFSPQNDAKFFSDNHDFILCYTKHKENWNINLLSRTEKQNSRYKNLDNDPRGAWTSGDISVKRITEKDIYEIKTPSGKIILPPKGSSWRLSKETFYNYVKENRIWFGSDGNSVPRIKRFLNEVKDGLTPVTIWLHNEVGHNQSAKQDLKKIFFDSTTPFDTPKPTSLIEKILQIATNKDSIILDSFAGSATTAHAVLNLNKQDGGNRKFILIEMEDYAESITAERIKRVINGYGEGTNKTEGTNGDFSYYELGEPLFIDNNYLNERLPLEELQRYIWHTETKQPLIKENINNESFLIGKYNDATYYFYYDKNKLTTLNYEFLKTIKDKSGVYVIYADNCVIPEDFMLKNNIIFKKIPRDITRF